MSIEESILRKSSQTNEYGYSHLSEKLSEPYSPKEMDWLRKQGVKEEYTYEGGSTVKIHPACITCQARHIIQYRGHPNAEKKHPFDIKCNGIPGAMPPGSYEQIKRFSTEKDIPEERAKKLFQAAVDPVAWAELMFGFDDGNPEWHLRWYQKISLRCSSKRQVLRLGRRVGKTFTMALKLLNIAFTKLVSKGYDSEGRAVTRGPQVIIATPFQAQLTNIFDEMEKLLKRNEDLTKQVTSKHGGSLYTKSPFFLLELSNGATISGFVTGVEIRQDGSAGGSLRGQSGSTIYIDEMDMIPEEVLEKVIIPILATSPDTHFYATSTPIGKAGKFHELCSSRPDFKNMWLPSTVLSHWDQYKNELEYTNPSDDGFIAEYMAEFVESASGVFKARDVYGALRNYTYVDSSPDDQAWWRGFAGVKSIANDLVTVIGIDWNKNAGSEFVVIRYDQVNHRWWLAETTNISPGQFNSVKFKEEVWRLNFKWKPDWIYADEGYGHHIIDDIHFEAHRLQAVNNHQDPEVRGKLTLFDRQKMKLGQRLKKFNFSQKVELVNPVDGTPLERTGKEFLVENAVRVFEEGRIGMPADEVVLRTQMLNYIILRRHKTNGRPVYGLKNSQIGDHRLDAMMLALGGLFLERHPLYSRNATLGVGDPGLLTKDQLVGRSMGDQWEDFSSGQPGLASKVRGLQAEGKGQQAVKIQELLMSGKPVNAVPHQRAASRSGGFPGNTGAKAKSPLEQLFANAPSYNGYDDDTRAFYEAKSATRSSGSRRDIIGGTSGGFGFVRKPGRPSSGRRGSW